MICNYGSCIHFLISLFNQFFCSMNKINFVKLFLKGIDIVTTY